MTNTVANKELVITRIFDAPRELVYQAFVDPDQIAQWFGPVGFSVPRDTIDIDARTGGHQRMVMVSDDDPNMTSPVDARFTEVIENELLVGAEEWDPTPGEAEPVAMYMRLEFHDEGDKTRIVLRQGPYTEEVEGMAREGWNSSFTKLDNLLGS
ncbi:SRPBCC family protein [Micromonospora sp. NBC_01796]|uniref:SRPBCC family protein n=1 Tax=Micromonospora sp. NBC_01796 TaxID=2975987 RepID=UPI002DDC83B2|nr:SRPBCC domain-containing protein [Micromonospora sp. NBC_01796]WSA85045.1 SRPBCC domain-containing protein [Micromonospora sp. NBC_01796]